MESIVFNATLELSMLRKVVAHSDLWIPAFISVFFSKLYSRFEQTLVIKPGKWGQLWGLGYKYNHCGTTFYVWHDGRFIEMSKNRLVKNVFRNLITPTEMSVFEMQKEMIET